MPSSQFNPLVSIIIPVYNGSNFLREAIFSALAQTYPNIEVIVINDGSNDNNKTDAIARSFGETIRYFYQENKGVASALNLGISQMRGDYFSWLSHDDIYLPEKIATQIKFLTSQLNKQIILYSNYELINEKNQHISYVIHDHEMLSQKPLYSILRGCIHGCSLLIPKIAFAQIDHFDTSLKTTQDYDLWFKMIKKFDFVHMENILIKSRWHDEQDSKKNARTLSEGNNLWKTFIDTVSPEDILNCENSPYQFYKSLANFLEKTPFIEAHLYAQKFYTNIIEESLLPENLNKLCVTVIIPFHNRITWTLAAILSVQSQTHQNLEILIIDNNSTDDISGLLNYIKCDSRIKYYKQPLIGASQSRNLGLSLATGEYICFLDSDDLWISDKIETQLKEMIQHNAFFSHTAYQTFNNHGYATVFNHADADFSFPAIIKYCGIATPTVMIKKTIIDKHCYQFPDHFSVAEDVCLWILISEKYTAHYINQVTTYVRLHGKNAAYDINKEIRGLINIAAFVGDRFEPSQVTAELHYLLSLINTRAVKTVPVTEEHLPCQRQQENHTQALIEAVPHSDTTVNHESWLILRCKRNRIIRLFYAILPERVQSFAKKVCR